MSLTVAQLNIAVGADTSAAVAALQGLGQQFPSLAAAAVQGSQAQAAGIQRVSTLLEQQNLILRTMASTVTAESGAAVAATQRVASGVQQANVAAGSLGQNAGRSLFMLSSGMNLAGVQVGPLNQGLMLLGSQLTAMPARASAVQKGLVGIGIAALALGALTTAAAAPQSKALAALQNAVVNTGVSWSRYRAQIAPVIDQAANFGHSQSESYSALSTLVVALGNATTALSAFRVAEDFASGAGISLSSATGIIARAAEGYGRGLKVYGINLDLTTLNTKGLTSAERAAASAKDAVTRAQQSLTDATNRGNVASKTANDGTRQLRSANEALSRSEQDLVDIQERIARRSTEQHHEVADATMRLSEAQARLAAIQDRITQRHAASADTLNNLKNASQAVQAAQEAMATAQGGTIQSAQESLRSAIDAQRKALDDAAKAQLASKSDKSAEIAAQDAVTRATQRLHDAQLKQAERAHGESAQQQSDAIALRHAQENVQRATEAVAAAQDAVSNAAARAGISGQGVARAQLSLEQAQKRAADAAARVALIHAQQADLVQQNYAKAAAAVEKHFAGAASRVEHTLGGFFDKWKAKITNWLADVGDGFGKWLVPIGLIGTALPGLAPIFGLVATAAEAMWLAITGPVGIAILGIIALVAAGYAIYRNWDTIKHAVAAALEFIKDKIMVAVHFVTDHWRGLLQILLFPFVGLPVLAIGHVMQIIDFIATVPGRVRDLFSGAASWLVDAAARIASGLISGLYGALAGLANVGKNVVIGLWNGISSLVGWLWDRISGWVGSLFNGVLDFYDAMLVAGSNIVIGIWNGIADKASWLWDKITGFAGSVWDTFKSGFGLWSPSHIARGHGQMIVEGLALGIEDGQRRAAEATRRLAAVVNSVPMTLQPVTGGNVPGENLGALAGAGGGSLRGSVTVLHNEVRLDVQGHVLTEHDLVDLVDEHLIRRGKLPSTPNFARINS